MYEHISNNTEYSVLVSSVARQGKVYRNKLYRGQLHFPNFPQFLDISETVLDERI